MADIQYLMHRIYQSKVNKLQYLLSIAYTLEHYYILHKHLIQAYSHLNKLSKLFQDSCCNVLNSHKYIYLNYHSKKNQFCKLYILQNLIDHTWNKMEYCKKGSPHQYLELTQKGIHIFHILMFQYKFCRDNYIMSILHPQEYIQLNIKNRLDFQNIFHKLPKYIQNMKLSHY